MSTKKSHRAYRTKEQILADQADKQATESKSVVAELQAVVEELRARGMTDIDVHSLVNMIFQGWLVAGQPTQEYLDLAVAAKAQRELDAQGIQIIDTSNVRLG